jgi:hypothetical protein
MADSVRRGDPRFFARLQRAEHLLEEAVPREAAIPVNLSDLLRSFGVGEPLVEVGGGRHGGLRRVGDCWRPVVYRRRPGPLALSPRERFTVGHELAHAIVEEGLQLRPVRNSQYWALEEVCDQFASRSLLPEVAVRQARVRITSASSAFAEIKGLASLAKMSLAASARRILVDAGEASAWGIRSVATPRAGSVYRVAWTAGKPRYGVGTLSHVREPNPLFDVLHDTHSIRAPVEMSVGGAAFACAWLSSSFAMVTSLGLRTDPQVASEEPEQRALSLSWD